MRIQFLLQLMLLVIVSVYGVNSAVTCNSHPAFPKVKQILTNAVAQDSKGKSKNDQLQQSFQNAQPVVRSAQDLGVCSHFSGQSTCCDSEIVKLIDKAALLKIKPIQQQKSAFQKLVRVYATQLNKVCNSQVLVVPSITAEQIFANSALITFQTYRQMQATYKINFAKAISSYTRGAMCSICAGVDQVSNYFNPQGQLKISPDSISSFEKATNDAINGYANFFSATNIDTVIKELNRAYIKKNDQCGATVSTNVKTIFINHKVVNDDGSGGKQCKGGVVYSEQTTCQNILQGNPQLEQAQSRFLTQTEDQDNEQLFRLLQATPDAVQDPNGIKIYIQSYTDNLIDENGDAIKGIFEDPPKKSSHNLISQSFRLFLVLVALFII